MSPSLFVFVFGLVRGHCVIGEVLFFFPLLFDFYLIFIFISMFFLFFGFSDRQPDEIRIGLGGIIAETHLPCCRSNANAHDEVWKRSER